MVLFVNVFVQFVFKLSALSYLSHKAFKHKCRKFSHQYSRTNCVICECIRVICV